MQDAVLHGVDARAACYALCNVYSIGSMVCAIAQHLCVKQCFYA